MGNLSAIEARWPLNPTGRSLKSGRLIELKERSLAMLKKDLILRNPLRLLGHEDDDIINAGEFGAVLARHGVGKTALIVQIALNTLLRGNNVLHISLSEPVGKVSLWYRQVFQLLAEQYNVQQINALWDAIAPHRFIMTFQAERFSVATLEERLTDLTAQDIFLPHMMIIDGLSFNEDIQSDLAAVHQLADQHHLPVWFTVTTHRHEDPAEDGLPVQLSKVQSLFSTAISLEPIKDKVHICALKDRSHRADESPLLLDPSTMLIQKRN